MKAYKIYISILAVAAMASCSKVLEKRDLTALQSDLVFNDSTLALSYVDYIYGQNLPLWGGTAGTVADRTDESHGNNRYMEGTLQINDVSDFGTSLTASTSPWLRIRVINNFLVEIEKGFLSRSFKNSLKGQAYFFRAWRYWELVKLYGGVPLVLSPLEAVGPDNKELAFLPRNKTSECIAQIAKDLDSAFALLPGKWPDPANNGVAWGRITSGAAAALKGRVLVYWASPQFNPTQQVDRWEQAYQASKLAKTTLQANGFGLHANFETMWFTERNNPEAVFITGFNNSSNDQLKKNNGYDNSTRPAVAGGSGGSNQPGRMLVDAFPMKDGKPITGHASYNAQTFYKDRDPRFYRTIAYNGTTWTLNSINYNRFWSYFSSGSTYAPFAPNTTQTAPTNTGFFCRKAIDPSLAASNVQFCGTDWMEIRYAEVLLNLAEAACGTNRLSEAYDELKAIRQRAGIAAGADGLYGLQAGMDQDQLFKAILLERQIELAFEGKRYWDMRRWKLFESVLNGKRRNGTTYTFKSSATVPNHATFLTVRETMNFDTIYVNNMTLANKVMDTYNINWKPEYYFFALPQATLDNNPALQQTNGWPNGSFDPLQ
ncbi:MAG TPA: RagB/SusD family nutrient uptake outer membrane protein [Chitinophagaceae bacterium]|nr:RagB/SusD family nutrient uptake outer membrane protein [Chitinophagaceae bacterium]